MNLLSVHGFIQTLTNFIHEFDREFIHKPKRITEGFTRGSVRGFIHLPKSSLRDLCQDPGSGSLKESFKESLKGSGPRGSISTLRGIYGAIVVGKRRPQNLCWRKRGGHSSRYYISLSLSDTQNLSFQTYDFPVHVFLGRKVSSWPAVILE